MEALRAELDTADRRQRRLALRPASRVMEAAIVFKGELLEMQLFNCLLDVVDLINDQATGVLRGANLLWLATGKLRL
jgi:hypothetical protein